MIAFMTMACLLLAFISTALLQLGLATPPHTGLGSDLTLLLQNDLDWTKTALHTGALLVSGVAPHESAIQACRNLNESLLPTSGQYFESDFQHLLQYIALKTGDPRQRFWIGAEASSNKGCSAISLQSGIQSVPCESRLATLCSQSAPYRRNTQTDLDPKYQVEVLSEGATFIGTRDKLSFRFLGIPYTDPFERFTYSKVFSGTGRISALKYGSPCAQGPSGSEDCLFLNIYTPFLPRDGKTSKELRPVMFFIHGGGFTGGDASATIYDGGSIVSRGDVVFVTTHYRLGTLGFLALDDGITNGNFGIADQITALQWVHKHIAAFGGDPNRVTILGNSAGAGSVRALLAAKPSFGLFHAAVAHSNLGGFGYATAYSKYYTITEQYQTFSKGVVQAVGCSDSTNVLECLRGVSAGALLTAPNSPRYIIVDGKYITTDELKLDGTGPAADVHVIFGWTRDDGADFIGSWPTENTTALQKLTAAGLKEDIAQRALDSDLFPLPVGPDTIWNLFNQTSRISTDGQFLCVDQATLSAAATHKVFRSIYAYQFDRTYGGWEPIPKTCNPAIAKGYPYGDPSLPYFRCHDGELRYVLGNLGQDSLPFRDGNDLAMTQLSMDVWTSFARTFNPNPSPEYLKARGYTATTSLLKRGGRWNPVTPSNKRPLKLFDIPFSDSPWLERRQCEVLGYPLSLYI